MTRWRWYWCSKCERVRGLPIGPFLLEDDEVYRIHTWDFYKPHLCHRCRNTATCSESSGPSTSS